MHNLRSTSHVLSRAAATGLLAVMFALGVVAADAQDVVFGGETSFSAGLTGSWDGSTEPSPTARVEFDPDLSVFADTAELRASGSLTGSYPDNPLTAALDVLSLRLYPADWMTLDVGLQRHAPGAALLLSPVDYLMPVTLDLGSGGQLPQTTGTAAILGVSAFVGSGFVSAYVEPAPAPVSLPDTVVGALTDIGLLSELDDPVGPGTLSRAAIEIDRTTPVSPAWRRVSASVEAGVPLGPVDLTAIYYHGTDRIPVVTGTVSTTGAPVGEFTLALAPAEHLIDAFGLSAQTAAGPASFWLDGSWVIGRRFGTTALVDTATPGLYELETITAPHVELVAGGVARFETPPLTVAAEYRHGFVGSDRTDVIRLDFPGTALVSVTADLADGLVSTTAAGIVLIPDRSAVVIGSVTVSPSSELSASIQAPFVIATPESLLGGLRSRFSVTAALTYRF